MNSKLCLLLFIVAPSAVFAQEKEQVAPEWGVGADLGYAAMNPQIIDDIPHLLASNDARITGDPSVGGGGGEGFFGVHAGRFLRGYLRADALLSLSLLGVLGGDHAVALASGEGTVTTAEFDSGSSAGFITTGIRFVAEDVGAPAAIRPRATFAAVWQWTKGPAAIVSAGFTTGNARTRFTVDAGEQFSWLGYDRTFRTYRVSDNALLAQQQLNGTKRLRGFSLRFGVDHYVFSKPPQIH